MKKITQIAALSAALCISNTMEADDKMGTLTPKEQNIALAAAYAAKGDQNGLKGALAAGLDSGVSVNEYKEVLVQVYAYCGFPRSLNSLGTFMELLKERGGKDAQGALPGPLPKGPSIGFGTENQTKLTGREVKGPLFEFAPAIDEFLKAHLFGDIFARDNLDWKTRENCDNRNARRNGRRGKPAQQPHQCRETQRAYGRPDKGNTGTRRKRPQRDGEHKPVPVR